MCFIGWILVVWQNSYHCGFACIVRCEFALVLSIQHDTTTNGGEKRRTAYGRWMSRAENNQRYIKQRIAPCEERIFRCERIKHGLDRLVPVDYDHIVCYRNIARLNVANEPYVSAIKWYMTRNLIKIGLILPIEMSFFLIFVCLHETAGSIVWERFAGSLWPSKFGLERRLPASRL